MRSFLICSFLAATAACGGSTAVDADPFATYEECYTEHAVTEGLPPQHAITVCCIDHPIGTPAVKNVVCGETAAACNSFVTAQLAADSVAPADVTAACTDYINQRGV